MGKLTQPISHLIPHLEGGWYHRKCATMAYCRRTHAVFSYILIYNDEHHLYVSVIYNILILTQLSIPFIGAKEKKHTTGIYFHEFVRRLPH